MPAVSGFQQKALQAEVERIVSSGALTAADRAACARIGITPEIFLKHLLTERFPTAGEAALRDRLQANASVAQVAALDPALSAVARTLNIDPGLLRHSAVDAAVRKVAGLRGVKLASRRAA